MSETPMSPTLPPRARHVMRLAVEALASVCLCPPWNTDREHRENDRHERHTPLSPTSLAVRHQGPTCRGYLDGAHKSCLSHTGRAAHLVGQYSVDEIQYGVGAGGFGGSQPDLCPRTGSSGRQTSLQWQQLLPGFPFTSRHPRISGKMKNGASTSQPPSKVYFRHAPFPAIPKIRRSPSDPDSRQP